MRRISKQAVVVLGLVALSVAISCEDNPDDVDPACEEAVNHSDLPWLEDNVFRGCSNFTVCHKGSARSANGVNLEKGNVIDNLVGKPHSEFTDRTMVIPGDPDNSYLMVLLGAVEGPLNEAGTMPYQNPLLCQEKIDAISRWITSLR